MGQDPTHRNVEALDAERAGRDLAHCGVRGDGDSGLGVLGFLVLDVFDEDEVAWEREGRGGTNDPQNPSPIGRQI